MRWIVVVASGLFLREPSLDDEFGPFRPEGEPFVLFKTRCINFVHKILDRANYRADRIPLFLPKCLWKKEDCAELQDDLMTRVAKKYPVEAGAPAPAPAPAPSPAPPPAAFIQIRDDPLRQKPVSRRDGPSPKDSMYAWCDLMFAMTKKNERPPPEDAKDEKEEAPAPAPAPQPETSTAGALAAPAPAPQAA